MQENLPDMNLKDIEESASEGDDEVLPLDFITALIESENKIIIQAKPLIFKTEIEDGDLQFNKKQENILGLDSYLEIIRKEAFKEDEGAVMIEPDINIKEKFDQIDLPCNLENRINNSMNAPKREKIVKENRIPHSNKTYDTDTDTEK